MIPELLVERLVAGELSPEQAARVRARLEAAGELQRIDALHASNAQILTELPPRVVAARVAVRRRRTYGLPAFALLIAAVLAMVVLWPQPTDRIKGDAQLEIHRLDGDHAVQLHPGDAGSAGDLLRLSTITPQDTWGAVISIDGRGEVTVHLPAQKLPAGAAPLHDAFQLDDAPAFERFVLVTADRPFTTATVSAAAHRLDADTPLALAPFFTQTSFVVVKKSP